MFGIGRNAWLKLSSFKWSGVWYKRCSTVVRPPRLGIRGLLQSYLELSKFRLGALVVFSTTAGYVLASGSVWEDWASIDWGKCAWVSVGTAALVGAANTLNQVIERNRDRIMARTSGRPPPLGRLSVAHAIGFALVSTALGTYILHTQSNTLTTALGLSNLCLYAFIYTPLKMWHPINTWVGAVVGAIPPMMGAAAVLPGQPSLRDLRFDAWLMGGAVPVADPALPRTVHFIRNDYARAGYRMPSISNLLPTSLHSRPCPGPLAGPRHHRLTYAVDSAALAAYMRGRADRLQLHPTAMRDDCSALH